MKNAVRFLALFLCFVLLFSFSITPAALNGDAKFATYINMEENGEQNGYQIPNLFRQDAVYSNISKFPLVVYGGEEYVPISMFILYSYVEVNYSKTTDSFFLVNKNNNHYISFNVAENVASTHNGELLQMTTKIFNKTRYIPARAVANILGFVCESYDDGQNGVYSFRISDGKSKYTLEQLLKPYLDQYIAKDDGAGRDNKDDSKDPINDIAPRTVCLCYTNFDSEYTPRVLTTLKSYGVSAAFAVSETDILERASLVREAYSTGHSLVLTAELQGENVKEYAKNFVDSIEKANAALKFVLKKKTRLCILPENAPQELAESKEFISELEKAGYVLVTYNTITEDGASFTGSAYTVSTNIKNKITSGFDEKQPAIITAILYCSDKTAYYSADIAGFVNKYEQFDFCSLNEGLLMAAKEN